MVSLTRHYFSTGSSGGRGRSRRFGTYVTGAHGLGVDCGMHGFRSDRRPELGRVPHRPTISLPGVRVHVRRVHTSTDHCPR